MKKIYLLIMVCLCISSSLFAQLNETIARTAFLSSEVLSRYNTADIQSLKVTNAHLSTISGIHHYYFMQEYQGIGIYNAVGSAHFNSNAELIKSHSNFEERLAFRITSTTPKLTAMEAIISASSEMKYKDVKNLELKENKGTVEQQQIFTNNSISKHDIPARLMYQPMPNGDIRLAWDISILELIGSNWWSMRVDAETGKILDKYNWTVSCNYDHQHDVGSTSCQNHKDKTKVPRRALSTGGNSYNVYAMPLQSPADGNRTIETDPEDTTASPYGWHDTDGDIDPDFTITRGNNAHAYEDMSASGAGSSPDGGGSLTFDFLIDTTYTSANPSQAAAVTNLFYWNNIIHDLLYHYGFTEAAGNFQENNYGNGGAGNDYVRAEAQDGSGDCNANFSTPNDGNRPRMQMYTCGDRDGDLDNLVVVHEYGHGVSNRLTGGGGNTSCLGNSEQMGEGWSDYLGLMMTLQTGDQGTDAVGVGTWLTGEGINGPGIRTHPYSTDMAVNPHTYADINGSGSVHFVGSVWCEMLWEMTWALIDQEGFDTDFYSGTGGNNIAMKLVMEGMKLQPCSPGFVDGRDAILLADEILYGGTFSCLIWDAFAKRGLGYSASQGSSGSTSDGTEAFDFPSSTLNLSKIVDKIIAAPGDTLTYTLKASNLTLCGELTFTNVVLFDTVPNNTFYVPGSASNGGSLSGNVVSFPLLDSIFAGDSIFRSFSVYIDSAFMLGNEIMDDIENGSGNWTTSSTGSNNWNIDVNNPRPPSANSWFAQDVEPAEDQYLELAIDINVISSSVLSFWHAYDTESGWDGGVVQYSLDSGSTWLDLGPYMIKNGYNSMIDNNIATPAFSGNSGGYIETRASLSSFVGQNMNFRFWMSCDASVDGDGWYIDDVGILSNYVDNTAQATADGGIELSAALYQPTILQYAQCINGVQDGDETGIDCGGAFCAPCPSCTDGIQNAMETGIDCGGPDCPICPTCSDGIQNGNEIGVDCGGPDCMECPCLENDLTLSITFDSYPEDISWEIQDSLGIVVHSGDNYNAEPDGSTISFDFCMPDGCYEFFLFDSYGDGLCCTSGNGSYTLSNNIDTSILATGGDFNDVDSTDFCLIAPPMNACDSLLSVHGIITAGVYHANNILISDGTVQSIDSVIFKSGTEINLIQDFEVELGAEFEATIEACTNALNLIRAQQMNIDKPTNKILRGE